jgi:hypothetical protein
MVLEIGLIEGAYDLLQENLFTHNPQTSGTM